MADTSIYTSKYLQELINQKKALANNLVEKGVEASEDEKFNTLVPKVLDIQTGGGSTDGKYRIRYFDIDGTVLKEEYLNEGDSLTPPDNPSYDSDYLVFDSWNYDIENTVVEDRDLDIGAIYNTIDNSTYLFCRFTSSTGLNPSLKIIGSVTIDWGDGTVNTSLTHTYSSNGEYIIKITGSFSFNTGPSIYLMGSSSLNKAILKGYFSNVENFTNYCFQQSALRIISLPKNYDYSTFSPYEGFKSCTYLEYITIPNLVTTFGYGMFNSCYSLTNISIPNSVTTIPNMSFKNCYCLESITIPNSVTSIGDTFLSTCYTLNKFNIPKHLNSISDSFISRSYSLESVIIPESVTSIGTYFLAYCYKLKNIIIPENVTSIDSDFLSSCYLLKNVFILCKTALTVGVNLLQLASNDFTIWVNDVIYNELQAATNWSTYASYMKKLSDCPQHLLDEHGIERPEPLPEPSGFKATFYYSSMYNTNGYYSVDGGNTWTQVGSEVTIENVTEVKLKITAPDYIQAEWINETTGETIIDSFSSEVVSGTIALTEDTTFAYNSYD